MLIKRCLNCGGLVLKRKRIGDFCSPKCKNENIEKQMRQDDTLDLWEDTLIKLDLLEKKKSKEFRILRR